MIMLEAEEPVGQSIESPCPPAVCRRRTRYALAAGVLGSPELVGAARRAAVVVSRGAPYLQPWSVDLEVEEPLQVPGHPIKGCRPEPQGPIGRLLVCSGAVPWVPAGPSVRLLVWSPIPSTGSRRWRQLELLPGDDVAGRCPGGVPDQLGSHGKPRLLTTGGECLARQFHSGAPASGHDGNPHLDLGPGEAVNLGDRK